MVWTVNADGRVDFVNQRALDCTGLEARALEGWGREAIAGLTTGKIRAAWRQGVVVEIPKEGNVD